MREYFILITPENAVKGVMTENPGLYFFYKQVGCQSIEIVRISRTRAKHVLVVDEEGRLKENPQLNAIASLLAKQPIYGNALLAKEDLRNGEPDIVGFDIKEALASHAALHVALIGSGHFEVDNEREEDNDRNN